MQNDGDRHFMLMRFASGKGEQYSRGMHGAAPEGCRVFPTISQSRTDEWRYDILGQS